LRILIADDHMGMRTALKAWLETHAGWQICGEATNGLEAVQKAAELKPDVIILDLAMPKMDGLQAAGQISSASPTVPILVYTNYAVSQEAKLEAKKHGVREVINKGASPNQLVDAVELLQGQRPQSAPDETRPDTEPHAGTEEARPRPG
jgi:DNA-binding NarL/FixJ family response regulator